MDKRELRVIARSKIRQLSLEYKQKSSKIIACKVINLDEYHKAQNIFIYLSTSNEPDTKFIIRKCLEDGKNVYIPKCIDQKMFAVKYTDNLKENKYGILEPIELFDTIKVDKIDTAVIPCLMASLDKRRLGHGKGYYDRFLNSDIFKLCLCFKELLSDEIVMDEHDIYMDLVVHE